MGLRGVRKTSSRKEVNNQEYPYKTQVITSSLLSYFESSPFYVVTNSQTVRHGQEGVQGVMWYQEMHV